jgi:hypothetical protein
MDIQFVFGNPVKGKKKTKQKGKRSMAKKKSKKRPLRNKKGQFVKRSKAKKAKKSRKNPEVVRYLKKSKPRYMKRARAYITSKDVDSVRSAVSSLGAKLRGVQADIATGVVGSKGASGARKRTLAAREKKLAKMLERLEKRAVQDSLGRKAMTDRGYVEGSSKYVGLKGLKRSNPVAKGKKGKKAKKAKKKARFLSGKTKLSALLKAATPKKSVRGKYKRKGKVAKVRVSRSAYRRAKNPIFGGSMIQSYLAHSAGEAGGLLVGGALYGLAGSLIGRIPVIGPKVVETLRKVPVVGPSLPTLLAGVVLVKLGERQRIDALRMVGKGLIGATVVGIGVQVSQKIPGLASSGAPSLAGVDYTALDGVDFTAMGADVESADFGSLGDAQMGEIAYGELPEGLSGVDFTMGDGADFGELPEGLGEGQMG